MSILAQAQRLALCLILPGSLLSSCAYRLSNSSQRTPIGVQTIAVEAVYDRSREVIPHELLWSAVQKEIIRNGRLSLTSQENADAILLVTIDDAKVNPQGTPSQELIDDDPPVSDTNKGDYTEYRNLRRAGSWTTDEGIRLKIRAEVIDLKSRAVLFKKAYARNVAFKSFRPVTVTPTSSAYLHYDEAMQAKFRALSESLATQIVGDFLR